jgi:type III pantothenate kinase
MRLVLDAGNSRVKWGVHDGLRWCADGALPHADINGLNALLTGFAPIRYAVISNVAGDAVQSALETALGRVGIPFHFIKSAARACGVQNGYDDPTQLGSDRWAALVAAWGRQQAPCIVVNAGTALTVDALAANGDFLGGLILPGLAMMKAALLGNTAGISTAFGVLQEFPANTGDAVHSGALRAMAGAVSHLRSALAAREGMPTPVIVAGGDAAELAAALPVACDIVDNLVLEGLLLIAKESFA